MSKNLQAKKAPRSSAFHRSPPSSSPCPRRIFGGPRKVRPMCGFRLCPGSGGPNPARLSLPMPRAHFVAAGEDVKISSPAQRTSPSLYFPRLKRRMIAVWLPAPSSITRASDGSGVCALAPPNAAAPAVLCSRPLMLRRGGPLFEHKVHCRYLCREDQNERRRIAVEKRHHPSANILRVQKHSRAQRRQPY